MTDARGAELALMAAVIRRCGRWRQPDGDDGVAGVDRQLGQQGHRPGRLHVLQRDQVVVEPARRPAARSRPGGTAGWPGPPCRCRAGRRSSRSSAQAGQARPAPAGRPGGRAAATSTTASVASGTRSHVRVARRVDEVGRGDCDVDVAAQQGRRAVVRFELVDVHPDAGMRASAARPTAGTTRECIALWNAATLTEPAGSSPRAAQLGLGVGHGGPGSPGPGWPARGPAVVSCTRRPVRSSSRGAGLPLQHGQLLGHARRAQVRGRGDGPDGAQRLELAQQPQPPRVERHARQLYGMLNSRARNVRWT